ncbi:MAG: ATP-binding protein [Planctomycetia bacterium]
MTTASLRARRFASPTPRLERLRINLSWFVKLRWAAVAGQTATLLGVVLGLRIDLPVLPLAVIIGVEAATNAVLHGWLRRAERAGTLDRWRRRVETLLGAVMTLDVLFLTAMLSVVGGPYNPFSIFFLVNVSLAAVVLRAAWAWSIDALAIVCFAGLFFFHRPLPALGLPLRDGDQNYVLEAALLIAFGWAATFIVYFILRVTRELGWLEEELTLAGERKARSEKLEALATLAAGAAHELSTPLSTIAVVARDLERELQRQAEADPTGGSKTQEAADDARLVRREVNRCRTILERMAADAGASAGEAVVAMTPPELTAAILELLPRADRVDVAAEAGVDWPRVVVPRVALSQALRGLVQNAIDASPPDGRVRIELNAPPAGADRAGYVELIVRDRGEGMPGDVLARAGEPFFTTKEPGKGMGLGIFLAHTVVERLGGSLALESSAGSGTTAVVRLPTDSSDRYPSR